MLARCGRVAHICEANFIGIQFAICFPCCNRTFLNFPVRIWKIREKQRQKFKQGNGAIAARWQAKAGVEPPFAGRFRPFSLGAMFHVKRSELLLGKPLETGSARLGHIPSLPRESQLPLKPCISLQPLAFQGNCDSSDCFLDFCFISWCRFDLLRKCGLLAHTSPAFLKNCWIKKLLFRLWLVACSRSCTLPLFAENTALSCNLLEIMVQ